MKKIFSLLFFLPFVCLGQTWLIPSSGPNGNPSVMKTYANNLVIGGVFGLVGSIGTKGLAYWNGNTWTTLIHDPFGDYPTCFEIINNKLYMGLGGHQVLHSWDGISFSEVSSAGFDWSIYAMKIFNNDLHVGGDFTQIGINTRLHIARFHNNLWYNVGGGVNYNIASVYAMEVYKKELVVAGRFSQAGTTWVRNIAKWNGIRWDSLSSGIINGMVHCMVLDTINDFLYVGGVYTQVGNVQATCIARWDGSQWETMDYPVYSNVLSMKFYNHELYAGGAYFFDGTGNTCFSKWDGLNWQHIYGIIGSIYCMEVFQDKLYIGGFIDTIETTPAYNIAAYSEPPPTHCNWLISRIYANKDTFYLGDTVHFENNNKYATSWTWDFGDGNTASVQKPEHIYQNSGVYNASVIVHQENCYDTAYFTVDVQQVDAVNNTKQKEYMLGNNIPNPFTNSTIIPYQIPEGKQGVIIITDTNGKEIARYDLKETKGNLEVSTEGWKAGIYYYSLLLNSKKVESKQMVITW